MTDQDWDRFNPKEWAMGHEKLCTERWTTSNRQLGLIVSILQWAVGGALTMIVAFAGYTYVNSQTLAQELAQAQRTQAQQIGQIPSKTAQAITGMPAASN